MVLQEISMQFMQAIGRATSTRDTPPAVAANLAFVDRIDIVPFRSVNAVPRRDDVTLDLAGGRAPGMARMAEAASRLSGARGDILSQLLQATCAPIEGAGAVLRPVWAFENFARARVMIRLLSSLDRLRRNGSPHMLSPDMERDAADRLSAGLSLVRDLSAADPVPCSTVLRHVVRDLVELFGPTVGEVSVATQVEPVAMANLKRRALVLVVCNLLLRAIADGFASRRSGTLVVSLQRTGRARMRLTIADNGSAWARDWSDESGEAIDDLAAVLGGRLVHQRDGRGGVISELTFPV
jgi:two-component sensor histidine kinase